MNIHEYQAKELFRQYGIPVPDGEATDKLAKVPAIAKKLGKVVVVKAQIHAGGRGKGGGVKVTKNLTETKNAAKKILGMTLVTPQTGPEGKFVKKLLIEEGIDIKEEYYVALLLDRDTSCPVFIVSQEGGMEIEEVADKSPEKIFREVIDPAVGLMPFQARKLAFALGLTGNAFKMSIKTFMNMYKLFIDKDCSQVEVNPFVVTGDDRSLSADAKVNFDDNAVERHPDILALRDLDEEEPAEVEASKYNLNFVKLDGNVGCMVNGAGLAMATMDVIKLSGGNPANFLDVGGGANPTTVENAFRIILQDKNVKGVLINVFGGIVRCDRVANGVAAAVKKMKISIPVVVRLSGTNAELGKKILEDSDTKFITATSLAEAAKKVVKAI
jgi:succinyl-CoA synthetase beta subunit